MFYAEMIRDVNLKGDEMGSNENNWHVCKKAQSISEFSIVFQSDVM